MVGGANDRIWARYRQNSWRWRVTDLTVEINTRLERDEGIRAARPAGEILRSNLSLGLCHI